MENVTNGKLVGKTALITGASAGIGWASAQTLDKELRPHGIKVGAICPGGVKTEFALGKGRTEQGVATSGMLDPEDVQETF